MEKDNKLVPWTKNTKEVRILLENNGFKPLAFFQGRKFLKPMITTWANKDKTWVKNEYSTFDLPKNITGLSFKMLDAEEFMLEIKK